MTSRAGFSPTEKALMLLSRETEGGLFMTAINVLPCIINIMHAFYSYADEAKCTSALTCTCLLCFHRVVIPGNH